MTCYRYLIVMEYAPVGELFEQVVKESEDVTLTENTPEEQQKQYQQPQLQNHQASRSAYESFIGSN